MKEKNEYVELAKGIIEGCKEAKISTGDDSEIRTLDANKLAEEGCELFIEVSGMIRKHGVKAFLNAFDEVMKDPN